MKLITLPNKILRSKSKEVRLPINEQDKKIIEEMIKHIDDSQKDESKLRAGIGIAAPQLGINKRMFYINIPASEDFNGFREFLINPKIVAESSSSAALEGGEGCLSIDYEDKTTQGLVHRKFKVIVKGFSYFENKEVTITKSGYEAIVIQHELDHLNGKLFIDRIDKKNKWKVREGEILI